MLEHIDALMNHRLVATQVAKNVGMSKDAKPEDIEKAIDSLPVNKFLHAMKPEIFQERKEQKLKSTIEALFAVKKAKEERKLKEENNQDGN